MEIQSHITDTIQVFTTGDLLRQVAEFFRDSVHSHVAITENGRYLGVISEEDLGEFRRKQKDQ